MLRATDTVTRRKAIAGLAGVSATLAAVPRSRATGSKTRAIRSSAATWGTASSTARRWGAMPPIWSQAVARPSHVSRLRARIACSGERCI